MNQEQVHLRSRYVSWLRSQERAPRACRQKQLGKLRRAIENLESRQLLAAHIVGSPTVYPTIQAAVDAAVAGQTITVDAGNYPEQVSIFKSLTIKGAQAGVDGRSNARGTGESIVTGAASGTFFTSAFKIGGNDVTLDGFTVQGESISNATTGAGIVILPNVSGTHIINDIVQNNVAGMYLANASATDGALIQHNVFRNNNNNASDTTQNTGRGIYTDGSISGGVLQNVIIDGNFFTLNLGASDFDVQPAIGLEAATSNSTQTNIQITNNVFDHNGKAVLAMNADHILIDSNVVGNHYDTTSGALRFEGNDHFVTITHNNLYADGGQAIRIDAKGTPGSNDNFVINNNNIYDNGLEVSNIAMQLVAGQYTGTLNATNNWWGSTSGPGGDFFTGTGNGITTNTVPVNISPIDSTYAVAPEVPYEGFNWVVTSPISAVNFDHGLEGVSYHDTSSGNAENQYRPNQDVDINTTTDAGSGFMVDDTKSGEWMKYTVNVTTAGTYTLSARVQSTSAGAKFHFEVDGTAVSSSITIPSSTAWQTVTQTGINLPAGTHVLRLVFDANNSGGTAGNWNWFSFALNAAIQPPLAPTGLAATAASGQINLSWSNVANETGYKIERSPDGSTGWTQIGTTAVDATTYSDTTVAPATTYFYRVRATNAGGDSPYSNTASALSQNTTITTLIAAGATWKYLDTGTNQGTAWTASGFNDSTWKSGPSELGYGDGDEATVVGYGSDPNNKFVTTYFRTTFNVSNPASISAINLGHVRDDGAVIYVNGVEAFRSNMPTGTITYTTLASTTVGGTDESTFFPGTINPALLVAGTNVIAVEIHQSDVTSSDISFNLWVTATATVAATPPAAPSNLVATAIAYNQINLTWADNSNNETGFIIERSTNGTDTWTQIATPGINATSYSDTTGLVGSTAYFYRIRATNSGGDSANSATATATTLAAPIVPLAPTSLVAIAVSSSQINLTWIDNSNNETGFIIERSLDGSTNWTQIAAPAANATTYSDSNGLAGSTTYYYRVRATDAVGPSANSNVANATTPISSTALPSGWTDGDIGSVGTAGSATYTSGIFTLKGAGTDIWNSADGFNFAYIPMSGDGSITAQVNALTNTNAWAKAGVMIRQNLTAGSVEASMVVTPTNGTVLLYRTTANGSSDGDFSDSGVAPYWVRLTRSGSNFTGAISTNGTTWTTVGTQAVSMTGTVYIGLVVASKTTGLTTATFANVTTTGTIPAAPTGLTATPISATQINLSWADVGGEAGFKIERSTDNITFTQIGTTLTGVTTYPDNTVSGTQTYYYRVKATNASGDSLPSTVASAQPLTPPAAASNLVATSAGLTQINLTWKDNSSNETGFKIERSPNGNDTWTLITTTAANATSYSDSTGLTSGTQYFYRVRATNSIGDAANSNIASATTAAPTAPNAPSNLVATAATTTLQINLTWTDKSTNETGFIVERSPNGNDTWTQIATPAVKATSYSDTTSLTAGTQYFYRVTATNNVGPSSPSTNAKRHNRDRPRCSQRAGSFSGKFLAYQPDVDRQFHQRIRLYRRAARPTETTRGRKSPPPAANATSYSDSTGLSPITAYFYRVTAINLVGPSAASNVSNATTLQVAAPIAPSTLVATAVSTTLQINLTWKDNSSNETGFIVERSPDGSTGWTQIATPAANATSFSDSIGLTAGTTFFYRVSATGAGGPSTPSNTASATAITASAPAAPSGLAASAASSSQINLTWTDNSTNETGFIVEPPLDGSTGWTANRHARAGRECRQLQQHRSIAGHQIFLSRSRDQRHWRLGQHRCRQRHHARFDRAAVALGRRGCRHDRRGRQRDVFRRRLHHQGRRQ